jgi:protein O-GlcNAc transferase
MATISEAFTIAIQHHQAGRLVAAEQIYRRILAAEPNLFLAYNNLGLVLKEQGKTEEAVACYRHALGLKPDFVEALNNLGLVLREQGRLDEAVACCRRAAELKPQAAEPYNNLGNALKDQGKLDEAISFYRRSLEARPDYAEAHNNLGNAFKDQGRLDEAVACYRRALELRPDYAEAHNNLGTVYKDRGELQEAITCHRRAMELKPDRGDLHSNLLYAQVFSPAYDAQALYEGHRQWNERHAARWQLQGAHAREPGSEQGRRLRVGYVSPYFSDHCQSLFTLPVFAAHDHEGFEIVCYSDVANPDRVTERLRSHADIWRRIVGLSDEQVAELVRRDRIDILVDLTMHMAHNRLLVFARKPAPVQVCWLAYPGTTGLAAMDYRITDSYLDPPDVDDGRYTEESIRLPDAFWCYAPLDSPPEVNTLPAAEKGHITFGCLNNFCKVNPQVLRLWAAVLRAVDRSRMTILCDDGTHRQQTLDRLAEEGVDGDRVKFLPRQPRPQYWRYYHEIDIGLDTVPYNGHTTSLDSVWMGVPVVTLVGSRVVGRAGLCQLMNLGLPELIATSPEQYVKIAAELAQDRPRLGQLRATLRERLRASPLMDAERFTRNLEAAYRKMWRRS